MFGLSRKPLRLIRLGSETFACAEERTAYVGRSPGVSSPIITTTTARGLVRGKLVEPHAAESALIDLISAHEERSNHPMKDAALMVGAFDLAYSRTAWTGPLPRNHRLTSRVLDHLMLDEAAASTRESLFAQGQELVDLCPIHFRVDRGRPQTTPDGAMEGEEITLDILALHAPRESVSQFVSLFNNCGLRLATLVAEPLTLPGIVAASIGGPPEVSSVIVDIGSNTTAALLWDEGGAPRGLVKIPIGGEHMSRDIAHALGLDFHEGDRFKRSLCGRDWDLTGHGFDAFRKQQARKAHQVLHARCDELARLLADGLLPHQHAIRMAYLTGGGSMVPYLVPLLETYLRRPVHRLRQDGTHPLIEGLRLCTLRQSGWYSLVSHGQSHGAESRQLPRSPWMQWLHDMWA